MLHKIFNRLFSILSSMNAIQKVKKDERGICYVTGFRRYISVLLDLIIIVLFLQFCIQAWNQLLTNSEDGKTLSQITAKHQMQVPLSTEEKTVQVRLSQLWILIWILSQIVQFIMLFSYVTYMWVRFAATPGKLLLGLRVVDAQTFKKMTLRQAIKRFFSFILSVAPLFLGFIWSNFNKRCQTWHDKIAGTVVVTSKSLKEYKG
ncbi:RDD family protein [Wolbachia endosymbiont of Ctenocephalides felis wCfeJ]|uniref:RDD family protein n=1 Tax=Wolbachia endosymbiont of Ctenocephalides felis wCfeJ TaxID=2732594 RepID=UPI001447F6F3|nr:RDD family protein [Wolbachia endosymbiont of Ctenocephalides felis wCfeJ]